MTTLTTRAGFDAFRDRMCEHFANLPEGLGQKPLRVEQAELGPDVFFTHRLDDDGHHIVYDPRQVKALSVRTFLGIYAEYTEGQILDWVRDAFYQQDDEPWRDFHEALAYEIDRAQDPAGVLNRFLELASQSRSKGAEAVGATT